MTKEDLLTIDPQELANLLRLPILRGNFTFEVFDNQGRLLERREIPANSWVRNAYNMLLSVMGSKNANNSTFGAGLLSIKITSGAVRYGTKPIGWRYNMSLDAPGNDGYVAGAAADTWGIEVGSGSTAWSFEDFILATKIANGTGGGQLSYISHDVSEQSYVAGTKTFSIKHVRYFNNNSGGNVSVNEVGIVAQGDVNGDLVLFLVERTVLDSTVTIPNTGQLKVAYTISLVYPA